MNNNMLLTIGGTCTTAPKHYVVLMKTAELMSADRESSQCWALNHCIVNSGEIQICPHCNLGYHKACIGGLDEEQSCGCASVGKICSGYFIYLAIISVIIL